MHGTTTHKYTRRPTSHAGGLTCILSGRRPTCGPCLTCGRLIGIELDHATRAANRAAQGIDKAAADTAKYGLFSGLYWPIFKPTTSGQFGGRLSGPFVGLTCGRRASSRRALPCGPLVAALLDTRPAQVLDAAILSSVKPHLSALSYLWTALTSGDAARDVSQQGRASGRTIGKLWPNDHPNDSTKSPERFRSNDSVNTPERLFTSKRTNMLQVLFIIGCLLVPAFNDWTEKCSEQNKEK